MTTTQDASPLFGLVLTGQGRTHLTDLVTGRTLCGRGLDRRTTQHAITDADAYAKGAAIRPVDSHCGHCDIAATSLTLRLVDAIRGITPEVLASAYATNRQHSLWERYGYGA